MSRRSIGIITCIVISTVYSIYAYRAADLHPCFLREDRRVPAIRPEGKQDCKFHEDPYFSQGPWIPTMV